MKVIWEDIIKANYPKSYNALIKEFIYVTSSLKIKNVNWLIHIFYIESGINHRATNLKTNAYGFIQFLPSTIKKLFKMNLEDFKKLNEFEQLDYIKIYLMPYSRYYDKFINLYLAIFFPLAIDKGEDFVLETKNLKAETIARLNKIYDINNDNKIQVKEIKEKLINLAPYEYRNIFLI